MLVRSLKSIRPHGSGIAVARSLGPICCNRLHGNLHFDGEPVRQSAYPSPLATSGMPKLATIGTSATRMKMFGSVSMNSSSSDRLHSTPAAPVHVRAPLLQSALYSTWSPLLRSAPIPTASPTFAPLRSFSIRQYSRRSDRRFRKNNNNNNNNANEFNNGNPKPSNVNFTNHNNNNNNHNNKNNNKGAGGGGRNPYAKNEIKRREKEARKRQKRLERRAARREARAAEMKRRNFKNTYADEFFNSNQKTFEMFGCSRGTSGSANRRRRQQRSAKEEEEARRAKDNNKKKSYDDSDDYDADIDYRVFFGGGGRRARKTLRKLLKAKARMGRVWRRKNPSIFDFFKAGLRTEDEEEEADDARFYYAGRRGHRRYYYNTSKADYHFFHGQDYDYDADYDFDHEDEYHDGSVHARMTPEEEVVKKALDTLLSHDRTRNEFGIEPMRLLDEKRSGDATKKSRSKDNTVETLHTRFSFASCDKSIIAGGTRKGWCFVRAERSLNGGSSKKFRIASIEVQSEASGQRWNVPVLPDFNDQNVIAVQFAEK